MAKDQKVIAVLGATGAQGTLAAESARAAGVGHYVCSTLSNVEEISDGEFHVPHFTNKAKVNPAVTAAGGGEVHSFSGGLLSWADIISILTRQGHHLAFTEADPATWDDSFPGAREIRAMFEYLEAYTYFGPDADEKIARANAVTVKRFTSFAEWAAVNMPVGD